MLMAVLFFPCHIRLLIKRVTILSLKRASGANGNFLACDLRISQMITFYKLFFLSFFFLGSVLRAALLTILYTCRIKASTNDMITHTRQILHTTTADQHDRVFLEVVTFSRDISDNFNLICQ